MRDLLLTLLIPLGLVAGLFSAPLAVLVLHWIWFQRPYDFSWGLWNTAPTFQIALIFAVASALLHKQFHLKFPRILVVYLALMTWVTLSAVFAYDQAHAWQFYSSYAPSMWVAPIVVFATINNLKLLKGVLWVSAGGIGFNAFKYALDTAISGGAAMRDQYPGFVGDNNVFGLVLCLVAAILFGLRNTLPDRRWLRLAFFGCLSLVILCIIYTKSRGALLTLGVIFLTASFLSGKPIRGIVLLLTAVAIGYMVIPHEFFDRLDTLRDVEADESAMGRVQNWYLAWDAAVKNPLLGVGPDNHIAYNLSLDLGVHVRVAHSVYFQTLGELGFVGLALYLAFVLGGLAALFRTWRAMITVARAHPDLAWVRDLALWMTCGYVGYLAGSALLNMFYIEFPWYVVFFGSMLWPMVQRELANREPKLAGGEAAHNSAPLPRATGKRAPAAAFRHP